MIIALIVNCAYYSVRSLNKPDHLVYSFCKRAVVLFVCFVFY